MLGQREPERLGHLRLGLELGEREELLLHDEEAEVPQRVQVPEAKSLKVTGALQTLQNHVSAYLQSKHARKVQDARSKGATPPQPPSIAKRDRTMFSHCIFDLEDRVLDCIDGTLCALGWRVASLIYDGVHVKHRDGVDLAPALRAAEAAVKEQLGYTIALTEKPLYDTDVEYAELNTLLESAEAAAAAEGDD